MSFIKEVAKFRNQVVFTADVGIAAKVGNTGALVVNFVEHWVCDNYTHQRDQYKLSGVYWTHVTKQDLLKKFPLVDRRAFDKNMKKLIEMGWLVKRKDHRTSEDMWLTLGPAFIEYIVECTGGNVLYAMAYQAISCPADQCDRPLDHTSESVDDHTDLSTESVDKSVDKSDSYPLTEEAKEHSSQAKEHSSQGLGTQFPSKGTEFPSASSDAANGGDSQAVDRPITMYKNVHTDNNQTVPADAGLSTPDIPKAPRDFGYDANDPKFVIQIYDLGKLLGITPKTVRRFTSRYDERKIWIQLNNLKYAQTQKDVKNPVGWLTDALRYDYNYTEAEYSYIEDFRLKAAQNVNAA